MNRSSKYNFYLPQNTDPISVSDFNYNFGVIDENLITETQSWTSTQKNKAKANIGIARTNGDLTKESANISNVERARWYKVGNIAIIALTFTVRTAITENTEKLFSGAPHAYPAATRGVFVQTNSSSAKTIRLEVNTNGEVTNAYTINSIPVGTIEGTLVYTCED